MPQQLPSKDVRSWQVAEEVSEKEAFELAKELGTVEGWQAFLKKFPEGFRADIARSYVQKLKGARPARQSREIGPDPSGVRNLYASSLRGAYRIEVREQSNLYVNNTDTGVIGVGPNDAPSGSGNWSIEKVGHTKFMRIRNVWNGAYLFSADGVAQSGNVSSSGQSSHWSMELAADESGHVVIRNRQTNGHLTLLPEGDFLFVRDGKPELSMGHWRLVRVESAPRASSAPAKSTNSPSQPKIKCSYGYIKSGSCRCRTGRVRVKTGPGRYVCQRKKKKKSVACGDKIPGCLAKCKTDNCRLNCNQMCSYH